MFLLKKTETNLVAFFLTLPATEFAPLAPLTVSASQGFFPYSFFLMRFFLLDTFFSAAFLSTVKLF